MPNFNGHFEAFRRHGLKHTRDTVPEIKRIESLDALKDLKLERTEVLTPQDLFFIQYSASVDPEQYAGMRKYLIDQGVAKRHNFARNNVEKKGTPEETLRIRLSYYGTALQISLLLKRRPRKV